MRAHKTSAYRPEFFLRENTVDFAAPHVKPPRSVSPQAFGPCSWVPSRLGALPALGMSLPREVCLATVGELVGCGLGSGEWHSTRGAVLFSKWLMEPGRGRAWGGDGWCLASSVAVAPAENQEWGRQSRSGGKSNGRSGPKRLAAAPQSSTAGGGGWVGGSPPPPLIY